MLHAGCPSRLAVDVPAEQLVQVDAEAPEKVPALQFPQVELPEEAANLPAAQLLHAELLFLSE